MSDPPDNCVAAHTCLKSIQAQVNGSGPIRLHMLVHKNQITDRKFMCKQIIQDNSLIMDYLFAFFSKTYSLIII